MIIRSLFLACLAIGACAPRTEEASDNRPSPPGPGVPKESTSPASSTPGINHGLGSPEPVLSTGYHSLSWKDVTFSVVCFDDREFHLRVADQPDGCGSLWMNAKSAAITRQAVAAINGGFFTPEGKPLGLLVEDGTQRGSLNTSSLGSGFYTSTPAGCALIRRDPDLPTNHALHAGELLQSGPFLVEDGAVTSGLSNDKRRRRSFLAWNGRHHWIMGQTSPTSLHALANALIELPIGKLRITTALNLDGGSSSDLWVSADVPNGNRSHRSVFNKPVRNYLVLTAR